MFKVKVTYTGGNTDLAERDTQAEAQEEIRQASLRMAAGDDIADIVAWEA